LNEIYAIEGYLAWKWGIQNNLRFATPTVASITSPPTSGLVVWNDASTLTQADGTALTTWANGGSGGTVNCTGTVVTNGLNGLRVVRLTTAQTWTMATNVDLSTHSFFFVTRQRGLTSRRVFQSTSNNQLYGYWNGNKRTLFIDNAPNVLTTAPSDTVWDIFSLTRTAGGRYRFNWQGVEQFTEATSAATNMTGLAINSGAFGGESSDCEIAEVILYNTVLTTTEVLQIEDYLSKKWGIPIGRSDHPHRRFRA
jgi:hypothetical protein